MLAMQITEEHKCQIEDTMSEIQCHKDFQCYKSRFEKLGKIRNVNTDGFLECLEEDSQKCQFSLSFGEETCCLCPLRCYIASELHK